MEREYPSNTRIHPEELTDVYLGDSKEIVPFSEIVITGSLLSVVIWPIYELGD
jgi:hypothetical protein